jgi:primary-amine oxidase
MEDVGFNLDLTKARTFKFPHENGINPNAGTPSSCPSVAKWPSLSIPVGKYIMQSASGEEPASVMAKCNNTKIPRYVRNRDIIIRHTFLWSNMQPTSRGLAYNAKKLTVRLAPANLISDSRGLDVLPLKRKTNKSIVYAETEATACSGTELSRDGGNAYMLRWVYTGYKWFICICSIEAFKNSRVPLPAVSLLGISHKQASRLQ